MSATAETKRGRKKRQTATADEDAGGRGSAGLWWGGMACGGLVMLSPGGAILMAALLAPVLLLLLLPNRHGGPRAMQAALLFGLAACVHPLHVLWTDGGDVAGATGLLRQPMQLATGWIALLGGWLVSEIAAVALRIHADVLAAAVRRRMMDEIAAIENEWGPMPASAPLPPL